MTEPEQLQSILQLIADEIGAETDFKPHQRQKIPLLGTLEEYDTHFRKLTREEYKELDNLSGDAYLEKWRELKDRQYPQKSIFYACAGLGDNEAVITVEPELKAVRVNIGNNDIGGTSEIKTDWNKKLMGMGMPIEEAESSDELSKFARDCTCGAEFFRDYDLLVKTRMNHWKCKKCGREQHGYDADNGKEEPPKSCWTCGEGVEWERLPDESNRTKILARAGIKL